MTENQDMNTSDSGSTSGLTTADIASGSTSQTGASTPPTSESQTNTSDIQVEKVSRSDSTQTAGQTELFESNEVDSFRSRWQSVQAGFVDEPRKAVADADQLVADVIKRLADIFAEERQNLEQQWDRGEDIGTEELRQALQRYRSFFDRLLSV